MVKIFHNGINYETKTKFEEYCKELIYNRIGKCNSVKNKSIDLFNELDILLKRHPEYEVHTNNMKDIKIITNRTNKKALECLVIYNDNNTESISWKHAYEGKLPTKLKYLDNSMRTSIRFQIMDFKNNNNKICAKCNSKENIHCDHEIFFKDLKRDFFKKKYKSTRKIYTIE